VLRGSASAGFEFGRNDIDEEIEQWGLGDGLGDIAPLEGSSFLIVGECPCSHGQV